MRPFDVLAASTPVYRSALLEASAGTGKTFAIEHLVVRLLIEAESETQPPCSLNEILAVTFTRAATREMKTRIRHNIARAIKILHHPSSVEEVPDYLQPHLNASAEQRAMTRMRLEDALTCFDEAQIFTLHGLCATALRERIEGVNTQFSEEPLSQVVLGVIDDFFRTELQPEFCSPLQLKRLLGSYRGDADALKNALSNYMTKGLPIARVPDFSERLHQFQKSMQRLTQRYGWQGEKIVQDFDRQLSQFKNLQEKSAAAHRPSVVRMAALFDLTEWSADDFEGLLRDGLVLAQFELKAQAKKAEPLELWYPELRNVLQEHLLPVMIETLNPKVIFALVAHHCQLSLQRYLQEEELGGPDQILQHMLTALEDPAFRAKMQRRYRVAIVDECQDTDPIQWAILNALFLNAEHPKPYLVLVGDPKQSIYAFRQADIYAYLAAAEQFSADNRLALRTNYRSHPDLVKAVNALFDSENCPGLIALPKMQSCLSFPPASAAANSKDFPLKDDLGAIHFLLLKAKKGRLRTWPGEDLERSQLFPAIAAEIQRLIDQQQPDLKQIAILVRDRHQAALMQQVLNTWGIPALTQRQGSLADSPARTLLTEWLESMSHLQNSSHVHRVLTNALFGYSPEYLLQELPNDEQTWSQLQVLRAVLLEKGFAVHFQLLLRSRWGPKQLSILERLLTSSEGRETYQELSQIAQLLIDHQHRSHCQLDGLLTFLDRFSILDLYDDERMKIQPDLTQDAVRILTVHMSKGLEYQIVFAPGLMKRTGADDILIPDFTTQPPTLQVADESSEAHQAFCMEIDAEKVRQAYVAMTRAKYRLYLPVAYAEEGSKATLGEAAPIELLLARLGKPLANDDELYQRVQALSGQSLCDFIDQHRHEVKLSYQWINATESPGPALRRVSPSVDLRRPKIPQIPRCPKRLLSFTSLQETLAQPAEGLTEAPHDFFSVDRSVHRLPAGRETGVLLHHLFEVIPYAALVEANRLEAMVELISPYLQQSALMPWAESLATLLFQGMQTPLPFIGVSGPQALCHVNPQLVRREAAFLYPTEAPFEAGFLRGSIDLMLSHGDRYYLVDWKSNWLGPTCEHYDRDSMHRAVQHHGYDLQAKIYRQALQRYLRLVDPRPFEDCFGGVFYLFLRGLDASTNSSHGVYVL